MPGEQVATAAASVEVVGASKRFGAKVALDAIDLAVPAGSFCVLLGPSGSGKTTLLRCLAGIERLNSGRVSLGSRLVAEGPVHLPPEQRDLSMVFQDYALWPHLSAVRNVAVALRRRRLPRSEASRQARRMLERVGLGHLADRYPNEMSGGEQQRVALARAMVAGTGILLFDEPLSNLDADLRERMRIEIATLCRESGATSIYITHDQSEAFALADVIGVLHDGHLVQSGPPEDVYRRPASPFVARFTGLAGELPVVVAGEMRPRWDGGSSLAVRPAAPGRAGLEDIIATVPKGEVSVREATLFVRPAGVTLLPPSDPQGHLGAVVLDTAYRGRGYDHALLVDGGQQLIGVHDERRWECGDRVAVRLAPHSGVVFAS
ncbi:MAG TPA: ABC transporter ATP-binding protein [Candidatus Dormibacteraeota bacterium]|jgi:ABC-type Fe3+/spermidine/putrescine transport system ATPase subunit|nr:ABC transporter ATP-binding protein [Candidatus Dormibacteraeota bacterium]